MRLIDADRLVELSKKYQTFIDKTSVETAPTVEAIPVSWFHLLCKQLEDRCPPDRECIVSGYEGTCEECWKEWCKDVLDEG